jgi:hypothetical protein
MDTFVCLLTDQYGIVRGTSTIEAHSLETAIAIAAEAARSRDLLGFELWQADQRVVRISNIDTAAVLRGPRYNA